MSEKDQPGVYQVDLSAEEMNAESVTVEPFRYEPKSTAVEADSCGPSCREQQMCEHERQKREAWRKFFETKAHS